jgi:hypothetical protein
MEDRIDMYGVLTLQVTDLNGQVVQLQRCRNRIVTSGRRLAAELFTGVFSATPLSPISHMGVGTGSNPPADADNALGGQRGDRKPITVTYQQFDEVKQPATIRRVQISLQAVFDYNDANDSNFALREAGIFNNATAGMLYSRVVFDQAVVKTNTFKLTLLWDVIF